MNYYEARQRLNDGRWDWTGENDGKIFRAGPCRTHDDDHATKEETEQHYYDSEIEEARFYEDQHYRDKCEVPDCKAEMSFKCAMLRNVHRVTLCETHWNKTGLKFARPFKPGIQVISSW